ncbi:MAG: GTP-binding protein [Proteobacteria bacterium]|nr:GTP-binding protein [Pseudomonadota bacterium]
MQRIPVSLITGFLGSGKTTLLNRLLRHPEAARTAVVVNEFGTVGLDHDLIEASDDNVVLLANGCLCCAMRGDLVTALDRLYRGGQSDKAATFERVLIETSGLADPSPVIQLLLGEPSLTARYRLDAVVTVVDAVNGEATLDNHIESVKQIAVADRLLVTKKDLLDADAQLADLLARIRTINPAAPLLESEEVLATLCSGLHQRSTDTLTHQWLRAESYSGVVSITSGKPHDQRFSSFCYTREEPMSELALELLIDAIGENLGPQLLRIKGLINVLERPGTPALIHGAQKLLHGVEWLAAWPSDDQRTRIVFITLDAGREMVEELVALADRIAANTQRARQRASHAAL